MLEMRSTKFDCRQAQAGPERSAGPGRLCSAAVTRAGAALWPGLLLLVALVVLSGCRSQSRPSPHGHMRAGQFETARDMVEEQVVNDREDRRYMLDRMRAGVLNLDAGDPRRAERWFAEVYDVLRTQGLNEDRTVASYVFTEGVKIWKGEPFEQAMALVYYGFVQASLGSWDNARAAASNALFFLRDFEGEGEGEGEAAEGMIDTAEIARRAAAYEAQQAGEDAEYATGDAFLDNGYVTERNNFTMAYLLHGIASQQLGRDLEASDFFNEVLSLNPGMQPLIDQLRAGDYNTILVVADGFGPRKVATGPGGALSRYQPITGDTAPMELSVNGQAMGPLFAVNDLNQLALDHRWNNLEDIRVAKNTLGNLALIAGGVLVLEGIDNDNLGMAAVGAGVMGVGLFLTATAEANTDHCDVFPQRLFVAALNVTEPGTTVTVTGPGGGPRNSATLYNLQPPQGPYAAFHYARIPTDRDLAAPLLETAPFVPTD